MRHIEPLTDAALDHDIAAALAVDPSPEFAARVRQRVSLERRAPARTWTVLATAAAAVALTAVGVVVWQSRRAPEPLRARPIFAVVTIPAGAPNIEWAVQPRRATRLQALPALRSARAPSLDATVLVDEREARAIRELIAGVVSGRIDLAPLLNTPTSMRAFLEVVPIPEGDTPTNAWPPIGGTTETGVSQ